MQILRTPDDRFTGRDGIDLRYHFVDDGANHFIQEDAPRELVDIIDAFARNGTS